MITENEKLHKLEVFLSLAQKASSGADSDEERGERAARCFTAFAEQLPPQEFEEIRRRRNAFDGKSAEEKLEWQQKISSLIGADELLIDENIHWSHIEAALKKEVWQMRRILLFSLPFARSNVIEPEQIEPDSFAKHPKSERITHLEKSVRGAFVGQFSALRNLASATHFDRLSGPELARLIRLAGIREVALACARIEAVESVAAFLRQFETDDARAIATQMSDSGAVSAARISFAESMVHRALEDEPNTSAMLDLLGFRLVAILLCDAAPAQIFYTEQKLPLDITPKVSEIIAVQRDRTPGVMRREIGRDIQKLAETIVKKSSGGLG